MSPLDETQMRELFAFRSTLRRYQRWTDAQALAGGLTGTRHQLLLAVAGHPDPRGPTIADLAAYLFLRHHSAVGLIDRAAENGLVQRVADPAHHRIVRIRVTDDGVRQLASLDESHRAELEELGASLRSLEAALGRLEARAPRPPDARGIRHRPPAPPASPYRPPHHRRKPPPPPGVRSH